MGGFSRALMNKVKKAGKTNTVLAFIQKLHRIEKLSKNQAIDEKHETRQAQTVPLLGRLRQWLDKTIERPLNSEKPKKAGTYLNDRWPKLVRYTEMALSQLIIILLKMRFA
jgi:transposase